LYLADEKKREVLNSAGILAIQSSKTIEFTVAGQRWTCTNLSPLPPMAVSHQNRIPSVYHPELLLLKFFGQPQILTPIISTCK